MVWYFFLEAAQSNWNRKKKGDENRGVTEEGHRQVRPCYITSHKAFSCSACRSLPMPRACHHDIHRALPERNTELQHRRKGGTLFTPVLNQRCTMPSAKPLSRHEYLTQRCKCISTFAQLKEAAGKPRNLQIFCQLQAWEETNAKILRLWLQCILSCRSLPVPFVLSLLPAPRREFLLDF